jgi:dihydroorotate dehydrogenase (NAD+) catalytic subunit
MGRPVIFHLLPFDARELQMLAEGIESLDEASATEVNLGEVSEADIPAWIQAAASSQLPVIAQFPLGTPSGRAKLAQEAGASAISLGPPRGTLPGSGGDPVTGRIYGPALLPIALRTVSEWAVELTVPLFGAGGVTTAADRQSMLEAGAAGVCLDTILWTEPELVFP